MKLGLNKQISYYNDFKHLYWFWLMSLTFGSSGDETVMIPPQTLRPEESEPGGTRYTFLTHSNNDKAKPVLSG